MNDEGPRAMRSSSLARCIIEAQYEGAMLDLDGIGDEFSIEPHVDYVALYEPSRNLIEVTGWMTYQAPLTPKQVKDYEQREPQSRAQLARQARYKQIRLWRKQEKEEYLRQEYRRTIATRRAMIIQSTMEPIVQRLLAIWRRLFSVPGGVPMTHHYRCLLNYFRSFVCAVRRYQC